MAPTISKEQIETAVRPTIEAIEPEFAAALISLPSQEEIAIRAYSYWEARGHVGGSAEEDWFRAERELACTA